jgi:hypothetical protein
MVDNVWQANNALIKMLIWYYAFNDGHELKSMQQMACKLWNKNNVKQMQDVTYSDHCKR